MNDAAGPQPQRIDTFFSTPAAREDRWRDLVDAAKAWAAGTGDRVAFEAALNEAAAIEEFHGYPGPQLMMALRNRAGSDDATGTAALAWRISSALLTRSFRQHAADWDPHGDISGAVPDVLPPSLGRQDKAPPYFEVLIVTGAPVERWPGIWHGVASPASIPGRVHL